ncbi:hypothetical protein M0R45_005244 [Rubus argutus]|uniref:Uncharacterized protein n=1 Tax=Rubus argutus TaxID=59490 RepID=A0AAW1YM46_RUBAR
MEGLGVRKGAWSKEEDDLLKQFIEKHGEGKWHQVPLKADLNRCRKSCRLRWLNYLKPNIKRGDFTEDEVDLIIRLHKLLGNRWSLIAGRLPGRTANDVKNHWKTQQRKRKASDAKKMKDKSQEKTNATIHYCKTSTTNLHQKVEFFTEERCKFRAYSFKRELYHIFTNTTTNCGIRECN